MRSAGGAANHYATFNLVSLIRSRRTWARSYCACCTSQPCSVPPKALDSLTAISGDMPRFPFTSSDSVLRDTPRVRAASVIVRRRGSMHSSNTIVPGCGGFFMVIGIAEVLSVVIDIIDVFCSIVETKNHSPIGAYRYSPKAFHLTLEPV